MVRRCMILHQKSRLWSCHGHDMVILVLIQVLSEVIITVRAADFLLEIRNTLIIYLILVFYRFI